MIEGNCRFSIGDLRLRGRSKSFIVTSAFWLAGALVLCSCTRERESTRVLILEGLGEVSLVSKGADRTWSMRSESGVFSESHAESAIQIWLTPGQGGADIGYCVELKPTDGQWVGRWGRETYAGVLWEGAARFK